MAKAGDFDTGVLKLFDGYVHGQVGRRTIAHFGAHLKGDGA